jgi:hypothetical protein
MKQFASLSGLPLTWKQPNLFKMEYELWDDDRQAAALRFRSAFGTMATAESADGSWTFKRVGFFKTHVTVRESGSETDLAVFHNDTWSGGGTLALADGRKYRLTTNFWQNRYEFQTEAGDSILRLSTEGVFKQTSTFETLAGGIGLKELPWMVLLGWYLVVMMQHDSAAAVAAT